MSPFGGYWVALSPRSPTRTRSATGCAVAGVRAYSAGCSTPRRVFSFLANHPDGTIDASAIAESTTNESVVSVIAHHEWTPFDRRNPAREAASRSVSLRADGASSGFGSTGNVDVGVSVTLALSVAGITLRAGLIAALAIVALLLTGWRKPARAEPRSPRGVIERGLVYKTGPAPGVVVDQLDTPEYHRPGVVRRLMAALAGGGIAILFGAVMAVVVSFGVAMAVIWLTDLLKQ